MLLTFLLSSVAFACPQIAGNYQCNDRQSGAMKMFMQQSKTVFKTNFRYRFEGNPWMGDEEVRVPVPYRWKEGDTTYTSACKGNEFSVTATRRDHAGKKFDTIERFEKTGERTLRFRFTYQNAALFDYSCRR